LEKGPEIVADLDKPGQLETQGPTALFDAVALAVRITKDRPTDRHVVLLLTDGLDNKSKVSYQECLKLIRHSDVLMYSVAPISAHDDSLDQMASSRLKRMSEISGAETFFTADAVETKAAIQAMASQIRHLYTIGFTDTRPEAPSRSRSLKVKLVSGTSLPAVDSHISLRYRETL
jgi:hypothetical protein